MLSCSIGTICAFLFVEVIPNTIFEIGMKFSEYNYDKNPKSCIYFGLVILFGMILAASLELLETDKGDNTDINTNDDNDPKKTTSDQTSVVSSFCDVPNSAKRIIFATIIHNMVDGMMIGIHPRIAIPLFFHEITHSVGQLAIYVNLGIGKKRSLMIRFFTDLFGPIAAISAHFVMRSGSSSHAIYYKKMDIYAHCLLIGLFTYVLLGDLLPILVQSYNDSVSQKQITNTTANKVEESIDSVSNDEVLNQKKEWSIFTVVFCFILSFATVTCIILLCEEEH